jgi:hypothetical protein
MGARPFWYRDWRLHFDAIARAIGAPPHQNPIITAGVMYPFTDLFVGDIKRSVAVWARDNHRRFTFTRRSRLLSTAYTMPPRAARCVSSYNFRNVRNNPGWDVCAFNPRSKSKPRPHSEHLSCEINHSYGFGNDSHTPPHPNGEYGSILNML